MNFYEMLQMDPALLKTKIRDSAGRKKAKAAAALALRAFLLMLFAVFFISALSFCFGQENSGMAVVIFCILLSSRFVDFGYRISDSLFCLAAVFLLLLFCPLIVQALPPLAGLAVNFCSMAALLLISCEKPEMGNGGLYLFGYLFLAGSPVSSAAFPGRCAMVLSGYLICAAVFFARHRNKNREIRFSMLLKSFSLRDKKRQWQLQAACGVSLLFFLGTFLEMDRVMWMGFACSSLLTLYGGNIRERAADRILGALLGSLLFWLLYPRIPPALLSLFGPAGGLCLGFCGSYRYKTVFNCLGALMTASALYGIPEAVGLRILNTLLGVLFALFFFSFFQKILSGFPAGSSQTDALRS